MNTTLVLEIALFLLVQTGAFLWWASRITTKVEAHDHDINGPEGLKDTQREHIGLLQSHASTLHALEETTAEIKIDVKTLLRNGRHH